MKAAHTPTRAGPPAGARHDTSRLPLGDFFFAPGAIEGPRKRRWLRPDTVEAIGRAVLTVAACFAVAAAIGFSGGWLTAKGWLL